MYFELQFQFLFFEKIDIQVAFRSPLCTGYVSQPGRAQHQGLMTGCFSE